MSASRAETVAQDSSKVDVRYSQLLVHTGRFFKKVSTSIRTNRRKSLDGTQLAVPEVFERSARSMDLPHKDLTLLDSQRHSLHLNSSPSSNSHSLDRARESTEDRRVPDPHILAPDVIVSSPPSNDMPIDRPNAAIDSILELTSNEISQVPREELLPPHSPAPKPEANGFVLQARTPALGAEGLSTPNSSVALASPGSEMTEDDPLTALTPIAGPCIQRQNLQSGQISPGLSDRRNLAPRLATLPPPMMASYMAKGSARLTPSVPRQSHMPILPLPALPLITPTQQTRQQAPLRSIPALPMRGPSESEQEADHGNALLEDDEDEEEEETDVSPGMRAEENGASDEDVEEGAETPRPRGSHILGLPQSDQSRLRTPFGRTEGPEINRGTLYFTPQADVLPTPRIRPGSRPGSSSSAAIDYFTLKRVDKAARNDSPAQTPRPSDCFGSPALRTPALGNGPQIAPMPTGSPRPGLYQLQSRSMVNLTSSPKLRSQTNSPQLGGDMIAEQRRSKALPGTPVARAEDEQDAGKARPESPQDVLPPTPTLRRQRSLPMYKTSSDPPPYPSFHPRGPPAIMPREEEGRERLPPYTNDVHLVAIMPRKVEFTEPGAQAKDRKWRRVLCVLEGTAFKVYKCPPGVSGVSAIEEWWEKKVGVGDITVANSAAVTQSGIRVSAVRGRPVETPAQRDRPRKDNDSEEPPHEEPAQNEPPPLQPAPPPTRSKLSSLLHPRSHHGKAPKENGSWIVSSNSGRTSSTLQRSGSIGRSTPSVQSRRRQSMDAQQQLEDPSGITIVSRASVDDRDSRRSSVMSNSTNSRSTLTTTSPTSSDTSSTLLSARSPTKSIPEPSPKDLIRAYTLQHAESGLASDYLKRKNVIRVRMEGEQFLLQARDVASVIDWIEGVQAATNIALDLDERPMPKGPMFPRRRRRRARAAAGVPDTTRSLAVEPGTANAAAAATTA